MLGHISLPAEKLNYILLDIDNIFLQFLIDIDLSIFLSNFAQLELDPDPQLTHVALQV